MVLLDYYLLIIGARVTAAAGREGVKKDVVIRHGSSFVVLQRIGKGKGVGNTAASVAVRGRVYTADRWATKKYLDAIYHMLNISVLVT